MRVLRYAQRVHVFAGRPHVLIFLDLPRDFSVGGIHAHRDRRRVSETRIHREREALDARISREHVEGSLAVHHDLADADAGQPPCDLPARAVECGEECAVRKEEPAACLEPRLRAVRIAAGAAHMHGTAERGLPHFFVRAIECEQLRARGDEVQRRRGKNLHTAAHGAAPPGDGGLEWPPERDLVRAVVHTLDIRAAEPRGVVADEGGDGFHLVHRMRGGTGCRGLEFLFRAGLDRVARDHIFFLQPDVHAQQAAADGGKFRARVLHVRRPRPPGECERGFSAARGKIDRLRLCACGQLRDLHRARAGGCDDGGRIAVRKNLTRRPGETDIRLHRSRAALKGDCVPSFDNPYPVVANRGLRACASKFVIE